MASQRKAGALLGYASGFGTAYIGLPAESCATFTYPWTLSEVETGNWVVKDSD